MMNFSLVPKRARTRAQHYESEQDVRKIAMLRSNAIGDFIFLFQPWKLFDSRADLFLSNDCGPLHIAAAVGAPTVGIYLVGNVTPYRPISHSRHRLAVSWRLDCPVCGLNWMYNNCGHRESLVADITVEEVLTPAVELLELGR